MGNGTGLLPRPSACQSVCAVGELWKNGWLDLDVVWGVKLGQSRMGVLDGGPYLARGRGGFWGFLPIGLNGVFECIFKTEMYSTPAWKFDSISASVEQIPSWCFSYQYRVPTTLKNLEISGNLLILENSGNLNLLSKFIRCLLFFRDTVWNTPEDDISLHAYSNMYKLLVVIYWILMDVLI